MASPTSRRLAPVAPGNRPAHTRVTVRPRTDVAPDGDICALNLQAGRFDLRPTPTRHGAISKSLPYDGARRLRCRACFLPRARRFVAVRRPRARHAGRSRCVDRLRPKRGSAICRVELPATEARRRRWQFVRSDRSAGSVHRITRRSRRGDSSAGSAMALTRSRRSRARIGLSVGFSHEAALAPSWRLRSIRLDHHRLIGGALRLDQARHSESRVTLRPAQRDPILSAAKPTANRKAPWVRPFASFAPPAPPSSTRT
jgi:hypothetical protein